MTLQNLFIIYFHSTLWTLVFTFGFIGMIIHHYRHSNKIRRKRNGKRMH